MTLSTIDDTRETDALFFILTAAKRRELLMDLGTEQIAPLTRDSVSPLAGRLRFVEGEAAMAAAKQALEAVRASHPWLYPLVSAWVAPLVEAALSGPNRGQGSRWITQWSEGTQDGPVQPDPAKHQAYAAYMQQVMGQSAPWLLPLLDSASALVIVTPNYCAYAVDTRLANLFPFPPEIERCAALLPWAEQDENAH